MIVERPRDKMKATFEKRVGNDSCLPFSYDPENKKTYHPQEAKNESLFLRINLKGSFLYQLRYFTKRMQDFVNISTF